MNDQLAISFDTSDTMAGFRLFRVEVYNWGTFHQKVWTLAPGGSNALLTGDIGSGKSTLVDAVTTLLVPSNRISYNKAAGADTKERTLRSYVLGHYKTERNDSGFGAKPVALRDHNSYSVILGVFKNTGYLQTVTLAQVFWQRDPSGQPNRFLLVADNDLSVAEHFADFGTDIKNLKKRLKALSCVEDVYESFPPYSASFRRRFGIESEQAMELFHQTVSMKSVGNLTEFVRSHMLESFDVETRIEALIAHFDDLSRAHDAVLKAKRQIEGLRPIVGDLDKYAGIMERREELRLLRDGLRRYFAGLKSELLERRLHDRIDEHAKLTGQIDQLRMRLSQQQINRDRIKQAIAENGGDRLERLKADIRDLAEKKTARLSRSEEYRRLAVQSAIPPADSVQTFVANQRAIREKLESFDTQETGLQNDRTEAEVVLKTARDKHARITDEIASLEGRRSNIDLQQISMRASLCKALRIVEDDVPFAGELLQVRPEDATWEGAIERLLRNFGLSLLVPERLYADVSEWVNRTNLRGRIVYFKVATRLPREGHALHPDSLVRKITIKPGCEFYDWIEQELCKRFDYACCDMMEQFRREKQAVTASGQVKSSGYRHEKDDRHSIDDRSRYVLGWSNEAKLAAINKQRLEFEAQIQTTAARIGMLQEKQRRLEDLKIQYVKLEGFSRFEEMDWKPVAVRIEELERERKDLEDTSNVLKTLNGQLEEQEASIRDTEAKLEARKDERSKNEAHQSQDRLLLEQCREVLAGTPEQSRENLIERLDAIRIEALGEHRITVESADNRQQEVREFIQRRIDNEDKRLNGIKERVIRAMQDYRRDYAAETSEIDAAVEAGPEFRAMLVHLEADDLPRFESRFKTLLNENTIRDIANFQSQLNRERQEIRERIDRINQSLTCIEYNKGRYILLEAQENADIEIRDFRLLLRACTEGSLTGSEEEQYAEGKFLIVKSIIDRFRGREGTSELDKRWTQKVTDVRNWFVFAASERWVEDHVEYEHYTDSGGKSGGQKEKLAYTVLAASLAYQFGLEWGETRSRSFRFVLIDEAFGRGSDESARFGLELFRKLNLQLLIVTPLQKIHIIEPYVSSVGFIYNPDGRESLLRSLTIEEYRAEKDGNPHERR